jgi:deoxyribodipyrimidine photo-lyase
VSAAAPTVVWFRRDLRVADHPALREAVEAGPVVCLFVLDPALMRRRHHRAPPRLRFLRAGLEALDEELRSRGSRLVVRHGPPERVVPEVAAEAGAGAVHLSRDVSPYARERDGRVAGALADAGVRLRATAGDLAVEPEDLPGSSGEGYRVFTPFHRAWREVPLPEHRPAPRRIDGPELGGEGLERLPDGDPPLPAGPAAARRRLVAFVREAADAYPRRRDLLAEAATSRLSAHLRLGMCTPAQIGRALGLPGRLGKGEEAFWRQVCWRDFYHHHVARNPEVLRTAFQPALRGARWDDDPADLAAWEAGETGYPLVDAGMRQLAEDAWIHNRTRMVAASFLTKDLLVDWRRGESVFMRGLVDGDPANNNGGWQWTAGTGTDAAPYFRVLNPVRQARRFDPRGEYVRRYVPELREVPDERIFEPWTMTAEEQRAAGCRIGSHYPEPRVDHGERRALAIERYRKARGDG